MRLHVLSIIAILMLTASEVSAQCTADAGPDVAACAGSGGVTIGGAPTGSGGSGAYTYNWTPAAGLSCTNCANPVADPANSTTYTVTIDDGSGCIDNDQVIVTVSPGPTASFSFSPNNQCASTPVQFNSTSTGNGLTYSWDFGNPAAPSNTSTNPNPQQEFIAPGSGSESFTVVLTVTDNNGCTDQISQTVTVQQSPVAALADPLTNFRNCDGSNFTLTVFNSTTPANNADYTIDWGDGSPVFNTTGTFTSTDHTYTSMGVYDMVLTVTGTNGCVDTETYLISNITNPAIGVANPGNTNGCGPLDLCFPLSNFGTNHSSTIYTIDYGDGTPEDTIPHAPPAQICHTYTESSCGAGGAYTFTISAINACDISVATINPIRVYTGPQANFTPAPVPACVNTAVTFTNTTITGFNSTCSDATVYTWDFGDGSAPVVDITGANQSHTYTAPGNYTVTLSAQNSCETTTHTEVICIEEPPVPDFVIAPDEACIPFNTAITNNSDTTNSCATTPLWTVLFNGSACQPATGQTNFINGTTNTDWEPEIEFPEPGQYDVELALTNSCGTFTTTMPVIALTVPEVVIDPLATICEGESVSPTATFTDCDSPITGYNWTFTGGTPANSNQEVPGTVTFNTGGPQTITAEATNACGTGSATTNITVNPAPTAPPVSGATALCEGDTLFLSTTVAGAGITYQWTGPNGFTSTLQNPEIENVTAADAGTYSLIITENGCESPSTDLVVTIDPAPVVSVVPTNPAICEGESVTLTASGATTYTWTPATGLSATTGDVVDASPTATTTYTVTGGAAGCEASADVTVTVNPLPVVDAGPDLILCNQPIPEQLTATPAGGTWSGPNTTPAGAFTPSGVGTFEVIYTYIDGNGCENEDTIQVDVQNPAVVTMPNDTAVCINSGVFTLSADPVGGTWSGAGVDAGGNFTPSTAGTETLTYSIGTGSCASDGLVDVTVNDLPVIDPGTDFSICIDGNLVTLNATPAGGTWSGNGITGGQFDPAAAGMGAHVLTYDYTDPATDCSNSATITATVTGLPVVDAGLDITLCNQPIPEQFTGTPAGGTWSGTNVTPAGEFTPNGVGVFTLTYNYTDGNGCGASDQLDVTVIDPVPSDAGPDVEACLNDPVFNLTATPAGGTWSGTGIAANGDYTPSTVGTFTVTYTVGSGTCLTTDNVEVTVHDLPVVDAGPDQTVCIDATPFDLVGTPAGGTWSGTGIIDPAAGTFDASVAGVGTTTITYSFTDGNGCSNTDVVDITVNALPVVQAGNDTTLCNQPIPVSFTGSPTGGTWSGANIDPAGNFTPNGVGSFTVTYTFTLGTGCSESDDMIVTVVDPVLADAGPDAEACIDDPAVQLNGLPAGGVWSGTNVDPTGLFTTTPSGTYTLTYSFGSGNCLTTDQMEFVVHDLPVVDAGADLDQCISEPAFNLTGLPAGGTWSGTGITDPVLGTFDPTNAGAGNHEIVYSYTDPITTCINTDTLIATVNPLPVPSFTNNPLGCINVAEPFSNTSSGATSYNWDFGDGNTSTQQDPQHTYTATGTYTIQLFATSGAGCLDSITGSIDIIEPPVADFTVAPDSGCAPLVVNFTDGSSGAGITYNWDFGNGTSSTAANPGPATYDQGVLADTTYYIELNVTNFCGTVTHTDSVIAMPSPTAVFGPLFDIGCSPYIAEFANNSLGLPDDYFWDFGDGNTSTTPDSLFNHTFFYNGTADTTYTIMLAVTNECGTDTGYHDITVLPNQVNPFFNTDVLSGCEPLTVNFTQLSQGGGTLFYSWDFGDGNTSTVFSPSHTFNQAGTYEVQLFVNDGCSYDTSSVIIEVFPSPTINFDWAPDSVCVNELFQFTNLSGPLASVEWDFGDGNTSILSNPTHSYTASGTYNVTLSGESLTNGCIGTQTQQVTVATNPIVSFTATPTDGCIPLPVAFTNTSTNANFYTWNFGDGNVSANANPNHTYSTDGIYTVTLIGENLNGCTDTATLPINAFPLPVADFTLNSTDPCYQPVSVDLTNQSTGAVGYAWDLGNGQTSALTNPTVEYLNPGTYDIELVATNQYGCTDTASEAYEVYELPTASFILDADTACQLQPATFTNTSIAADSVIWFFGDGNFSNDFDPAHSYADTGFYNVTLMVYTDNGCGDTITSNTSIQVFPSPTAGFTYENIHEPDPLSGTVAFANQSDGAVDYWWDFGDGNTSTEMHPIHRYYYFGDELVTLVAINEYGCTDTAQNEISIEYFKGLHIPNAIVQGHNNYELANFIPKGVGLRTFHIMIYDAWGNLMWECTELDADGRPVCAWDGTYRGKPVPQDAYVWRVVATFLDETQWEGKEYPSDGIKTSGTVTVLR